MTFTIIIITKLLSLSKQNVQITRVIYLNAINWNYLLTLPAKNSRTDKKTNATVLKTRTLGEILKRYKHREKCRERKRRVASSGGGSWSGAKKTGKTVTARGLEEEVEEGEKSRDGAERRSRGRLRVFLSRQVCKLRCLNVYVCEGILGDKWSSGIIPNGKRNLFLSVAGRKTGLLHLCVNKHFMPAKSKNCLT